MTGDPMSVTIRDSWWSWRRWSGWVLVVYAMALFTGTHLPNPAGLLPIQTNDKWLHFGAYLGLAFLLAAWRSVRAAVTWRVSVALWSIAALAGALDELTQMFPALHRTADVSDWIADVCGAATGVLAWRVVERIRGKRNLTSG